MPENSREPFLDGNIRSHFRFMSFADMVNSSYRGIRVTTHPLIHQAFGEGQSLNRLKIEAKV